MVGGIRTQPRFKLETNAKTLTYWPEDSTSSEWRWTDIKLANIVPIPLLDRLLTEEDDYHLVLGDLIVESKVYADFYAERVKRGDYVILDTMEAERPGVGTPMSTMQEAIRTLQPSEVVLPDVSDDGEATIRRAQEGIEAFREIGYTGPFMAVPHGASFREYITCAKVLSQLPGVECLGVYEQIQRNFSISRRAMVWRLYGLLTDTGKHYTQIHLLGGDEDCETLVKTTLRNIVRGQDSAKLTVWGLSGQIVTRTHIPPYPGRRFFGGEKYFYVREGNLAAGSMDGVEVVPSTYVEIAKQNIAYWRRYVAA